jgi:hypothetical protein
MVFSDYREEEKLPEQQQPPAVGMVRADQEGGSYLRFAKLMEYEAS